MVFWTANGQIVGAIGIIEADCAYNLALKKLLIGDLNTDVGSREGDLVKETSSEGDLQTEGDLVKETSSSAVVQ